MSSTTVICRAVRGALISLALGAGIAGVTPAHAADAVRAAATVTFAVPAGPLGTALTIFAGDAGVHVGAPAELVKDVTTAGVTGTYTVGDALQRLLAGTGLDAVPAANGGYHLRKAVVAAADVDAVMLGAITVSGKAPGSTTEGTGSYTTYSTSSSTRLNLAPQETPQTITVITRQRIDDQALTSLNDVLEATSGVTMKPFGVGADGPQIWARGASISNFQIDGVPSAALMSNYLQSTVMYDRVEIVKGATGMMSGLGTPAATINMIRKRPTVAPAASVSVEAGNWSRYGAGLDLSRALTDDGAVRGRVVADYKRQGAWTDTYKQEYGVLYGIVEMDLGPRTLLTASYSHIDRKTNGQIRTFPVVYSNGQSTGAGLKDGAAPGWTYYDHTVDSAFGSVEHRFDQGWSAKAELTHGRYKHDSVMATLSGVINQATGSGGYVLMPRYNADTRQTNLDAYVTGPFSLFGRRHEVIAGVTLSRLQQDSPSYPVARTNIVNIFNWFGEVSPPTHVQSGYTALKEYQAGAYVSARLQLGERASLLLGSRITDWKRDRAVATYSNNTLTSTRNREHSVVIPYAGLVYALNDTYALYGSYTKIFRPQDAGTLMYTTGGEMAPEEGTSHEAGVKGSFYDGALTANLALFRTRQDNLAIWSSALYTYEAARGTTTEGIEAELNGQLAPGWQLSAGYSYGETHNQAKQRILPRIPRNTFKMFTSYRLPGALQAVTVGGGLNWESKTGDPLATFTQHSFAVTNLMARYDINPQLSLTAHLNNAFDRRYAMAVAGNIAIYGPPRNFMLSLKHTF